MAWAAALIPAALALMILAYFALRVWADVTITGLLFESVDMRAAFETRLSTSIWLVVAGMLVAAVLATPFLALGRKVRAAELENLGASSRPRSYDEPGSVAAPVEVRASRRGAFSLALVSFTVNAFVLGFGFVSKRDEVLAARNAAPFGTSDPVFGRDLSFFIFQAPLMGGFATLVLLAIAVNLVFGLAYLVCSAMLADERGWRPNDKLTFRRAFDVNLAYLGLVLILLAAGEWISRWTGMARGGEVVAGPGAAGLAIGIPTATVAAPAMGVLGLLIIAIAIPALSRRIWGLGAVNLWRGGAIAWVVFGLCLCLFASWWWLGLLIVGSIGLVCVRSVLRDKVTGEAVAGHRAAVGFVVAIFGVLISALAPIGTALYDGVVLRGSPLQVERDQIQDTIRATRTAAALNDIRYVDAQYTRGGVNRQSIETAPAALSSVRFLDYEPAINAARRLQALNRYYTFNDADLDRYDRNGTKTTMFVFGREVDYEAVEDFQRRHFSFTHGKGVVMAPVNEIDAAGRPRFVVSGLPVAGLPEPLSREEIYFGAHESPWAVVNTDQPDGFTNAPVRSWKGAGIPVSDHKLAAVVSLGGLPYIGGGRRLWNALGQTGGEDSQLLVKRDIRSRVGELAPFLKLDEDPYFVVADKQVWVMLNAYTATDRYPYSARFEGVNYQRQAVTAVMNAYSGETKLYVTDTEDPLIRTWQQVYPSLFTAREKMPEEIAAHMRYGEDAFDYQAAALGRFHIEDVDRFFNNDDAWAPTVETTGPGAEGRRVTSPARFTYARLTGEENERFSLIRYFKPATKGRGIGFSAWLAASNEPEDFGDLSVLRFTSDGPAPLDSVDTFTANVGRDPELSAQIGVRKDQVRRGNTIVVPVGKGLLYVQPLYLDSSSDSLPTLWQVVVSFGDGRIAYGADFASALEAALLRSGGGETPEGAELPSDLRDIVNRASAAYAEYQRLWDAGDYERAGAKLREFERLLAAADAFGTGAPPAG
ncbi:UPF0182 family protein [Miltoncostaea oceani]|uniref:UPF0182 family protein n=1 Tax=Miltoncostaea oceani TaxID=2843216 RepID=UPI001C3D1AAF|nr:UPF0182 family protein [Miltoncostaea oceani]